MEGRNAKGQFSKGHKGFKPKGSRNRYTVAMMEELMKANSDDSLEFHPMIEAKKLYRETDDPRVKVSLLKEMLSFGNDKQYVEVEAQDNDLTTPPSAETMLELYKALHEQFGHISP
ncbi:hypothetical protein [Vibrio breoganii]|uniref:hypothetical protein n=1 Tax=Vibrio breoganii TaxID=553239 RepID=UPI000C862613|nr:hypothetical protein [Vibrio breoganii]PML94457.1 hypothetical protein BCT64_11500 [Vibrio breoganii]PMN65766.1 hypothetical protein BCT28_06095 [Vibrio breoganii]